MVIITNLSVGLNLATTTTSSRDSVLPIYQIFPLSRVRILLPTDNPSRKDRLLDIQNRKPLVLQLFHSVQRYY